MKKKFKTRSSKFSTHSVKTEASNKMDEYKINETCEKLKKENIFQQNIFLPSFGIRIFPQLFQSSPKIFTSTTKH